MLMATCVRCWAVLDADRIGAAEKRALRNHLLLAHPERVAPSDAREESALLRNFVIRAAATRGVRRLAS
jgi:hypothetical protein